MVPSPIVLQSRVQGDADPPLLSLRLLVPPLRLMTAFMWQVAHDQNVEQFGKLEAFVSVVLKNLPDLLSSRQKLTLIMGLRTKMLLEMCRNDAPANPKTIRSQLNEIQAQHLKYSKNSELENMQSHLLELVSNLLEDPVEKEYFFKRVYPVEYGPDFDKALQVLVGYFISRLEKFLPVPNFKQVSSWVDSASLWEECEQHLSLLEHLHILSENSNYHGDLGQTVLPSIVEDLIMSSLTSQDKPDDDHHLKKPCLVFQRHASHELQDGKQELHGHNKSHRDNNATSRVIRVRDVQRQTELSANKNQSDVHDKEDTGFDLETGMEEETPNQSSVVSVGLRCGNTQKTPAGTSSVLLNREKDRATLVTAKHPLLRRGREQASLRGGAVLQTVVPLEVVTVIQVDQHTREKRTVSLPKHKELHPPSLQQPKIVLMLSDVSSTNNTKGAVKALPFHNAPGSPNLHRNQLSCNKKSGQNSTSESINTWTRKFKCATCGLVLASLPKWRLHRQSHMADRTAFKCVHCSREFRKLSGLRSHQQVRADLEDPSLPPCLQPKRIRASAPAKTDSGQCRFCGETFPKAIELRRHMKTHPEFRPYQCEQCDKRFSTKSGYKVHMEMHTGEKPYLCSDCGKQYYSLHRLKEHMRIHGRAGKECCPYCDKQFCSRGNLNVHMRQHTGEKPYVCSVCEKAFSSAGLLQVHMRIHTGERPYRCDVCGQGFVTSSVRLVHMRIHSGARPFTCSQCGKRFNTRFALKSHMHVHTGMKPFKCSMCPKSYITRSHLSRHLQTHGL